MSIVSMDEGLVVEPVHWEIDGTTYLPVDITLKEGVVMPEYKTEGSAGCDVRAFIEGGRGIIEIPPMGVKMIQTGISMAVPKGFEVQVRSRSGLALKEGLFCLNAPGTIDSDYRGDIGVILANFSGETKYIHHGDRIAQLVFAQYYSAQFVKKESLSSTDRGEGGFGHTGVK